MCGTCEAKEGCATRRGVSPFRPDFTGSSVVLVYGFAALVALLAGYRVTIVSGIGARFDFVAHTKAFAVFGVLVFVRSCVFDLDDFGHGKGG
jgi:hypothetical protein